MSTKLSQGIAHTEEHSAGCGFGGDGISFKKLIVYLGHDL
jgi:hypothetical protein